MTHHPSQEIEAPVKRCAYCGSDLVPDRFHTESETVSSLRAQLEQAQSDLQATMARADTQYEQRIALVAEYDKLDAELAQARAERDAARSDDELQQKNITFKAKQLVELRAERDTYKTMYEFALQQHDKQEALLSAAPVALPAPASDIAPDALAAARRLADVAHDAWAELDHNQHEQLAGRLSDAIDNVRAAYAAAQKDEK